MAKEKKPDPKGRFIGSLDQVSITHYNPKRRPAKKKDATEDVQTIVKEGAEDGEVT